MRIIQICFDLRGRLHALTDTGEIFYQSNDSLTWSRNSLPSEVTIGPPPLPTLEAHEHQEAPQHVDPPPQETILTREIDVSKLPPKLAALQTDTPVRNLCPTCGMPMAGGTCAECAITPAGGGNYDDI